MSKALPKELTDYIREMDLHHLHFTDSSSEHKAPDIIHDITATFKAIACVGKLIHERLSQPRIVNMQVNQASILSMAEKLCISALQELSPVAGVAMPKNEIFMIPEGENKSMVMHFIPLIGFEDESLQSSSGTLFSIYKRITSIGEKVSTADFTQPGSDQIGSGYIIYGTSTILVMSLGKGAHGFTLDPSLKTFYLSHENIQLPKYGKIYSLNCGKKSILPEPIQMFIEKCRAENFSFRYTGSIIADFHRTILKGGILMYPESLHPSVQPIPLCFQCNPLAFIMRHVGGYAIAKKNVQILNIRPESLEVTSPFFVGSPELIELLVKVAA